MHEWLHNSDDRIKDEDFEDDVEDDVWDKSRIEGASGQTQAKDAEHDFLPPRADVSRVVFGVPMHLRNTNAMKEETARKKRGETEGKNGKNQDVEPAR